MCAAEYFVAIEKDLGLHFYFSSALIVLCVAALLVVTLVRDFGLAQQLVPAGVPAGGSAAPAPASEPEPGPEPAPEEPLAAEAPVSRETAGNGAADEPPPSDEPAPETDEDAADRPPSAS
jgi:hypothetical protein